MITATDLDWWLEFAASRTWTFARTYTASAPHHYVVQDRTPGVTHADVERAARVIHTFGSPGKYYSLTKIYLVSPDGRYRWWTEDRHFSDATLVNRATTDRLYGIQNAPATRSGIASRYDAVATTWDAQHPLEAGEPERVAALLASVRGQYPPHVLDIGCGTGRVLDLGLVPPARYAAVDSSAAMLNTLVRKHPSIAAVYPMDIRDALVDGTFTPGQFGWVFLDAAVELTDAQRSQVMQCARQAVIEADGRDWAVHDVSAESTARTLALADEMRRSDG